MIRERLPEDVLKSLEKGQLAPFYLFYGPNEFGLEKVLDKIKREYIPESARDFNLEVIYGDKKIGPSEIINHACSVPFMSPHRLLIIRRVEDFTANQLEMFLPYLDRPTQSTCLLFVSRKADLRKTFFKKIRDAGCAVHFAALKDSQVVPWIKRTAKDLGLRVDGQACIFLHQIAGNSLRDLHGELEKLYIRYGSEEVGIREIREIAIQSRIYTIFELMNAISERSCSRSLSILNRYLAEEDTRQAPLGIVGMLNRQIRLLWLSKVIVERGGNTRDVATMLGPARLSADDFVRYSKSWSVGELEKALSLLYDVDGLLKSSSRPKPVLEHLIMSICRH